MNALSAPRASRKTEAPMQTKIRGLGIEENDSKNGIEPIQSRFSEAVKPRGLIF